MVFITRLSIGDLLCRRGQLQTFWTVEAKVSFNASGGDTSVSLAVPNDKDGFKILNEENLQPRDMKSAETKKDGRIVMTGKK